MDLILSCTSSVFILRVALENHGHCSRILHPCLVYLEHSLRGVTVFSSSQLNGIAVPKCPTLHVSSCSLIEIPFTINLTQVLLEYCRVIKCSFVTFPRSSLSASSPVCLYGGVNIQLLHDSHARLINTSPLQSTAPNAELRVPSNSYFHENPSSVFQSIT